MISILTPNDAKNQQELLQNFIEYLPKKPYCTDNLGYLSVRPKEIALKRAYIQHNPIHRAHWLVFDLDYKADCYWADESVPTPNMTVMNPLNGHQHLFYEIDPAVYTLRQARQDPLKLAADVDRYLTIWLKADPSYGKLISKNPLNPRWNPFVFHEMKWDLGKLIDSVPENIRKQKVRKAKDEIGLGRNCLLFEKNRFFAYSTWRNQKFSNYSKLCCEVFENAMNLNNDFDIPLQESEVRGIVRSICKWTAKHLTSEGFDDWGDRGRKKSIAVRQRKSDERAEQIRAYKAEHPDMSYRMIAEIFDCNKDTVMNALKSIKVSDL